MDQVRTVTDEEGPTEGTVTLADRLENEEVSELVAVAEAAEPEAPAEDAAATDQSEEMADEAAAVAERLDPEDANETVAVDDAEATEVSEEVSAAVEEDGEAPDEAPAAAAQEGVESRADESAIAAIEEPEKPKEPAIPEILEAAGQTEQDQATTSEMGELPVEDWDYQRPKRGQVRTGIILAIGEQEIIVDVGVKRDGLVPYADMQRMGPEALESLSVGDEVPVYILRPEDQDGNLLVSLYMARQAEAWTRAEELAKSGKVWEETVVGYNKGGVVVPVSEIRGFVPASQLPGFPAGLSHEERLERLSTFVGETLRVKVIEINRRKRRLILSARSAHRQWRRQQRKKLLEDLREGEVRTGTVSSLANFGAFVDLGGADGLVHLSELSWRRVRHPKEVIKVGDKVDVYVLRLDKEKNRIGLSLKRLQPEPWALVEDKYELGQLIEGVVTNVADFGAFAEIDEGVEGLIHISELTDAQISHPRDVVKKGDLLLLQIIRIDARRKRLGLSLKRVLESEWAEWAAQIALAEAEKERAAAEKQAEAESVPGEEQPVAEDETAEAAEAREPQVLEPEEEGAAEAAEAREPQALEPEEEGAAEAVEAQEPQALEREEEGAAEAVEAQEPMALETEEEVEAEGAAEAVEAQEPVALETEEEVEAEGAVEAVEAQEPVALETEEEIEAEGAAEAAEAQEPVALETEVEAEGAGEAQISEESPTEQEPLARVDDPEDDGSGQVDVGAAPKEDSPESKGSEESVGQQAEIEDLTVDAAESTAADA